ncbi:MAG: thiolase [Candidatus Marinimicrobia bacterium]|nr:thiolase [Candidatus Neomarinimicrobiota bacterium]MDA1363771.1 thiolase [Candidatus Neomarinimicrobiota bacterium]
MNKASINLAIDNTPFDTQKSIYEIQTESILELLEKAGLQTKDIDGIATNGVERFSSVGISEFLGITPQWSESSFLGGSSYLTFVKRAIEAIELGICNVVVVSYGSNQRSARSRSIGGVIESHTPQSKFEYSQGVLSPISLYSLVAQRAFFEWGINSEDLAEIAISARKYALLNENAFMYNSEELTVEEVIKSEIISSPLHKLDCCLVTDGGGAVLVTNDNISKSLNLPRIKVKGFSQLETHMSFSQMPNYLITGASKTSIDALSKAGMLLSDIDMLQVYDSFTITVLSTLVSMGVGEPREIIEKFKSGNFFINGELPINTSGGGLSYCHPGMLGLLLIIEGVKQLTGDLGDRQVKNNQTALIHGTGGVFSTHSSMVLERV